MKVRKKTDVRCSVKALNCSEDECNSSSNCPCFLTLVWDDDRACNSQSGTAGDSVFSTEPQRGTVSSECPQLFLLTAELVLTASVCLTGGGGFHSDPGASVSGPEPRLHSLPHRRPFRVHAPRVPRPQASGVGSDGSGLRSGSGAHCAC